MKTLLTIIIVLVSLTATAGNKQATLQSSRFSPISLRTYYLETAQNTTFKAFVQAYKADQVQAVKGYKFENGTILKAFNTVYEYTTERPQATKAAKGQKRTCY